MVAVTGFDDREQLNPVLAYRYAISYEPYNFKGHVTDFPLTLAYGKKIDALRLKYREWIWDVEFPICFNPFACMALWRRPRNKSWNRMRECHE